MKAVDSDPEKAIAYFTAVINEQFNLDDALFNRAKAYLQLHTEDSYNLAVADLTRSLAMEVKPKADLSAYPWIADEVALMYLWRGVAYNDLGSNDLAVADFTESIKYGRPNPDVLENRAKSYDVLGQPDLARADLARAEALRHNRR